MVKAKTYIFHGAGDVVKVRLLEDKSLLFQWSSVTGSAFIPIEKIPFIMRRKRLNPPIVKEFEDWTRQTNEIVREREGEALDEYVVAELAGKGFKLMGIVPYGGL